MDLVVGNSEFCVAAVTKSTTRVCGVHGTLINGGISFDGSAFSKQTVTCAVEVLKFCFLGAM